MALVEQSLVESGQTDDGDVRLSMLETIREFAREQLAASGEAEAYRRRHAEHFLTQAERAEPMLRGHEQDKGLRSLDMDRENNRSALHWAIDTGQSRIALRMGAALWRFWDVRGHVFEGRTSLEKILAQLPPSSRSTDDDKVFAEVMHGAGILAYRQNDHSRARELHRGSLTLRRSLGDEAGTATSLNNLGLVALEQGSFDEAASYLRESLMLRRKLGLKQGVSATVNNLGLVWLRLGDGTRAEPLFAESLAICREIGDVWGEAIALCNLARAAFDRRDDALAKNLSIESLALRAPCRRLIRG